MTILKLAAASTSRPRIVSPSPLQHNHGSTPDVCAFDGLPALVTSRSAPS